LFQANDLKASGLESVSASCLFAIVGAVALEQGGPAAERLLKDKILRES
jgi:large subunit ribosomal protein L15